MALEIGKWYEYSYVGGPVYDPDLYTSKGIYIGTKNEKYNVFMNSYGKKDRVFVHFTDRNPDTFKSITPESMTFTDEEICTVQKIISEHPLVDNGRVSPSTMISLL